MGCSSPHTPVKWWGGLPGREGQDLAFRPLLYEIVPHPTLSGALVYLFMASLETEQR